VLAVTIAHKPVMKFRRRIVDLLVSFMELPLHDVSSTAAAAQHVGAHAARIPSHVTP
jgi:hypothetical protein